MATKKAAPAAKKVLSAEEKAAKFQEAVAYTDKLVKKAQAAGLKFDYCRCNGSCSKQTFSRTRS